MTYPLENNSDNPWIYRRDEIDLLEDEIEDIYTRFNGGKSGTYDEQSVIEEQMETEDLSDLELTFLQSADTLENKHISDNCAYLELEDILSLRKMLKEQVQRDPLYSESFLWADAVFKFAKREYNSGINRSKEMFRIYLNVKMVPIKLSITRSEDGVLDSILLDIIEKEYSLALTYIERVIESLERLVMDYEYETRKLLFGAYKVRSKIIQEIDRIQKSKGTKGKSGLL
jgi:hypothetical protein